MITAYAKEAIFHFNKKFFEDPEIPMWVLKFKGETYYINHFDCDISWSTKETPDNPSTKGSIKLKNCYIEIDDDNNAYIRKATAEDKQRLKKQKEKPTRIIFAEMLKSKVIDYFDAHGIDYTPIKHIAGTCGSGFYLCDIVEQSSATVALLGLGNNIRVLQENEPYYKLYTNDAMRARFDADEIDEDTLRDIDYEEYAD